MERVLKLAFIGASIKRGVERLYTAFLCPCPCLCVWHSGAFVIQRARYSSSLGIGACATRERTVPRVIIPLERLGSIQEEKRFNGRYTRGTSRWRPASFRVDRVDSLYLDFTRKRNERIPYINNFFFSLYIIMKRDRRLFRLLEKWKDR